MRLTDCRKKTVCLWKNKNSKLSKQARKEGTSMSHSKFKLFIENLDPDVEFDQDKIQELCADTDEETVLKILARFHQTLVDSIEKIQAAIEAVDVEVVWKTSHKISGSAELLGFVEYGHEARQLSHDLRANTDFSHNSKKINNFLNRTKILKLKIMKSIPALNDFLV